jgi:hypothetical protein
MMGARSLVEVPCPIHSLAHSRGGSQRSQWSIFFPLRSGRVHLPRSRCRPSHGWAQWRSSWLGFAAVAHGAACMLCLIPRRGVLWTRPWKCRAVTGLQRPGAGGCLQRPSRSAACRSRHRPDNNRPEIGHNCGMGTARSAHSTAPQSTGIAVTCTRTAPSLLRRMSQIPLLRRRLDTAVLDQAPIIVVTEGLQGLIDRAIGQ